MTGLARRRSPAITVRLVPHWMLGYRRGQLPGDITAGVMVSIIIVPQGLAFALLLGVPPVMGLYASLMPLIAFAVFAKGCFISPGPTPAAALAALGAVLPIASSDSPDFIKNVLAAAMVAGAFLMIFAALGIPKIIRYISQPVLNGFTAGLAMLVVVNQLPALLGIELGRTLSAPEMVLALCEKVTEFDLVTAMIGLVAVVFLANRGRITKNAAHLFGFAIGTVNWITQILPLVTVIAAALIVWAHGLSRTGVRVVGAVPQGLPEWGLPTIEVEAAGAVIIAGLTIALVIMIEAGSVETRLASKTDAIPFTRRNLLAMGAANMASAMTGGYPVSGGLARSTVNVEAGASTPLSAAVTALCILLIVIAIPHTLSTVPLAVLAAVIFTAGISQLRLVEFREAWAWNRAEGVAYLSALAGILCLGPIWGLLAGFGTSLALVLLRLISPVIVSIPLAPPAAGNQSTSRSRITVYGDINFLSASRLEDEILNTANRTGGYVEVVQAEGLQIDLTAHKRLEGLAAQLRKNRVHLVYDVNSHRAS